MRIQNKYPYVPNWVVLAQKWPIYREGGEIKTVVIQTHKNFVTAGSTKMLSKAEVKLSNIVDSIYCKFRAQQEQKSRGREL